MWHPVLPVNACCLGYCKSSEIFLVKKKKKGFFMFHDRSLLGRCFRGFVLPVLEYSSAVWCSAADTHLKLLYRAVSGARFLAGSVLCV